MAKREASAEYYAKIADDNGIVRGKIPSPLVRIMGARPGDYIVFRPTGTGAATMSVSRARGAKRSAGAAKKSGKKR